MNPLKVLYSKGATSEQMRFENLDKLVIFSIWGKGGGGGGGG